MPTFERGDMWDAFNKTGWFLITTNPITRKDGSAVMGRGIAKQAAERFPTLQLDFGRKLSMYKTAAPEIPVPNVSTIGWYGDNSTPVGWFMVKDHWAADAKLDIIRASVSRLLGAFDAIAWGELDPVTRVDLNFPGIGNGKLSREEVLPLLEPLPDYVHIWEY